MPTQAKDFESTPCFQCKTRGAAAVQGERFALVQYTRLPSEPPDHAADLADDHRRGAVVAGGVQRREPAQPVRRHGDALCGRDHPAAFAPASPSHAT